MSDCRCRSSPRTSCSAWSPWSRSRSTVLSFVALLWMTRKRKGLPDYTPPVTIFKPLKGVDEGLEDNLRSFFRLDYPDLPAPLRRGRRRRPGHRGRPAACIAEFPDHDAQLVVGCPVFGLNPKVENLAAMDRVRKHDTILISDSNVRVRPVVPPRDGLLPGRRRASAW